MASVPTNRDLNKRAIERGYLQVEGMELESASQS